MERISVFICSVAVLLVLAGCVTVGKPYIAKVDRVDQEMKGNRGFLKGTPPPEKDRGDLKRSTVAIDIDMPMPKCMDKPQACSAAPAPQAKSVEKVKEDRYIK